MAVTAGTEEREKEVPAGVVGGRERQVGERRRPPALLRGVMRNQHLECEAQCQCGT